MLDWNDTKEKNTKERKVTEASTGNRRQATEASEGNRRRMTEASESNRRKGTEASESNRRGFATAETKPEETYAKAWEEAGEGNFTELQQYLLSNISSARFDDMEEFKEAVGEIQVLTGISGDEYEVLRVLDDQGGESAVLLCQDSDGDKYAAKIYYDLERRQVTSRRDFLQVIKVRTKIIEFSRKRESSKYILPIEDIGMVSLQKDRKNYFEIQPYCEDGDLGSQRAMNVEELLPVIRHLNEALHYIHENGLLHMDIKPENLYLYEGNIVIGDFGIAHIMDNNVRKTEHAGGTDGYRAPETLFIPNVNKVAFVLTGGVDYYSLGVTLASLFKGSFIFEGIENEMASIMLSSFIPLPDKNDEKQEIFQNLVNGLCQYDNKVRFGYEDVKTWLTNPYHKISSHQDGWSKSYIFAGQKCKNELELYEAFAGDWNNGKKHLYRGLVKEFFADMNPDLANRALEIVEEENPAAAFPGSDDTGLFKFLKYLYPKGQIIWRGHTFAGLAELGEEMRTTEMPARYGDMLKKRIVSTWLNGIEENQNQHALVREIETLADDNPELACRWFGYAFAEEKQTEFLGYSISTAEEMVEHSIENPDAFYGVNGAVDQIVNVDDNTTLYGFLYSQGFRPFIRDMFLYVDKMGTAEKARAVLHLFHEIANAKKNNELIRKVKHFYKYFGPFGYLPYLQSAIRSGKIYETDSREDQKLMDEIAGQALEENLPLSRMESVMQELAIKTDKMRKNTQNNPFMMELGMMEQKTIRCKNLCGMFCWDFLGNMVPLGYESMINGTVREEDLA